MTLDAQTIAAVLDTHLTSIGVICSNDETEGIADCDCGWEVTLWTVEGECECFADLDADDYLTDCTCDFGKRCDQADAGSRYLASELIRAHLADELAKLPGIADHVAFAALEGQAIDSGSELVDPDALAVTVANFVDTPAAVTSDATRLTELRAIAEERMVDAESAPAPAAASDPIATFDLAALDSSISSRLVEWTGLQETWDEVGQVTLSKPSYSSIDAMTVRSGRNGIGRLLLQSGVLLVNDEAQRDNITEGVEAAGWDVRRSIAANDDTMFNGDAKAIGAWGNVIGFEVGAGVLVALVDLDTDELFYISPVLEPSLLARLERMGVAISTIHPPTPTDKRLDECNDRHELLHSRLTWFYPYAATSRVDIEPRYAVPTDVPLRVNSAVAEELLPEIVAAFEEQLRGEIFDGTPVREGRGTQYWERANGVLDADDVEEYRRKVPIGVDQPNDCFEWWDTALDVSVPHAPTIWALFLHTAEPEWWSSLPLEDLIEGGTWLVGHSQAQPSWLRRDHSRDEERRLQAAVSFILSAVSDLPDFRAESRREIECALCGRRFEKGMLQAGDVYRRLTSEVCDRCASAEWPRTERGLSDVQRAGLLAALRWYSIQAGHPITKDEYLNCVEPFRISSEAAVLMDRDLPDFVVRNWDRWLKESGAQDLDYVSLEDFDFGAYVEDEEY